MLLITGSTGTVGSEIVRQLKAADMGFRALVHRGRGKSEWFAGPNIEIYHGEYDDPASLDAPMQGMDTVFLLCPSDPRQVEREANLVDAAVRAGVQQIVKLSILGASPFSPISTIRNHWESEKYIEATGVPYTFVRPNTFMQNLLRMSQSIASQGKLFASMKHGKISMIDVRDIAAIAIAALTQPGHENSTYEITGPQAISYDDVARTISTAIGRHVEYVNISPEQSREAMLSRGLSESAAEDVLMFQHFYSQGFASMVTPEIFRLTGRDPISFDQFAHDYADIFSGRRAEERMAA